MKILENYSDFIFKAWFLITGFMFFQNVFFGKEIYSYVQTLALILGAMLLAYRFIFKRHAFFRKELIILSLFILSYVVSSLLNIRYGYYENIKVTVFLAFDFFLLFPTNKEVGIDVYKRQFHWLLNIFIFVATVSSIISLIMMIHGYGEIVYLPPNNLQVLHGFMWGRLFGIYYDPNYGSTFAAIAIIASMYFLMRGRSKLLKWIYILSVPFNFLYIVFSDSRTGVLALFIGSVLFSFLCIYKRKKWFWNIFCIVALGMLCFWVPGIIKDGYNNYIETQNAIKQEEVQKETNVQQDPSKSSEQAEAQTSEPAVENETPSQDVEEQKVGREQDLEDDFSNRRFDLWGSGIEIFKEEPIFGVSFKNLIPFMHDKLPNTYALKNDNYTEFDNMHNIIFNVLPSQGIVGIIILGIAFLWFLLKIRVLIFCREMSDQTFIAVLLGVCGTVAVSMMTVTDCIYTITPSSILFWISLGLLLKCLDERNENIETQKVLIGYLANNGPGGLDKYIHNVLSSLSGQNVSIDCLTSNPSNELEEYLKKQNVNLLVIPRLTHPVRRYYAIAKYVKNNQYKIAYFNISEAFDCIGNFAVKNYSDTRIITHSHNAGNDETQTVKRVLFKLLHYFYRPCLAECTDYYFACSSQACKWLYGKAYLKSYRLIRNTIEVDKFWFDRKSREQIREELGIKDSDCVLGFVGHLNYQKNVVYLAKVFKELHSLNSNYKLMIIGQGELKDELINFFEKENLSESVFLLGPQKDVYKYYSAMDIFVLLSRFEGLGIVGLEAQVNGLLCIFSNTIPQEVKITENAHFLNIRSTPSALAHQIQDFTLPDHSKGVEIEDPQLVDSTIQKKEFIEIFCNNKITS